MGSTTRRGSTETDRLGRKETEANAAHACASSMDPHVPRARQPRPGPPERVRDLLKEDTAKRLAVEIYIPPVRARASSSKRAISGRVWHIPYDGVNFTLPRGLVGVIGRRRRQTTLFG